MPRKIGILGGTGPEGSGLAYRWARAGEHIVIGSRDAQRAAETAKQLRERIGGAAQIEGTDNAATAGQCDVVVLTVPFSGQAALLKQLKTVWKPGTIVIDTTVPLAATVGGAATRMLGVWQGSAAEQTKINAVNKIRPRLAGKSRGFTLIEVIMAMTVLVILLAVGAPALTGFVKSSRITSVTNDFLANIAVGRSESVKRGARTSICVSSNSTTATPSCTGGGASAWKQGYIVFADLNGDGAFNAGSDSLLRVVEPLAGNITLASTGLTAPDWFQYRPSGSTNIPAAGASFKLCDDRTGNFGKTITISITGRTQVTTGIACP